MNDNVIRELQSYAHDVACDYGMELVEEKTDVCSSTVAEEAFTISFTFKPLDVDVDDDGDDCVCDDLGHKCKYCTDLDNAGA